MIKIIFPAVLACVIVSGSASAQNAASIRTGQASSPVAPVMPFSAAPGGATLVSPLSGLGLTPTLSAPSLAAPLTMVPAALVAQPSALTVAVAPAAMIGAAPVTAAKVTAVVPAAAALALGHTQTPALSVLSAATAGDKTDAPRDAQLGATFDGSVTRAGDVSIVEAPVTTPRRSFLGRAALAAGVFIAQPAMAIAAQAPAIIEPGAMTIISLYAPLATAITAVLGALFGLWSSRSKDGSSANAGQVFSTAMSYGAIAGAAAFALIDLTQVLFLGASAAALAPLTFAVVTASLAQSAFSAKFMDPATTPADRIMGAFPAVAMAFGLGIGAFALIAPTGLLALSTMMLMATSAATALYTALFRLEKSAAGGPAAMGRGFVLQTLMTGLALALGPSPYALFFFGLGVLGFASVMRTTATEFWASVPESFKSRFKR